MKKTTLYAITVVIGIMVIISVIAGCSTGIQTSEDWAGKTYAIGWDEVNVREEYSTSSEIMDSLNNGEQVLLTGRYINLGAEDNATASWVEIQLEDGSNGWIVRSSIQWMP